MHSFRVISLLWCFLALAATAAASTPVASTAGVSSNVLRIVELQTALVRDGISPGPIDGLTGGQTESALRAFQQKRLLKTTGTFDDNTRTNLPTVSPLLVTCFVTTNDLARV